MIKWGTFIEKRFEREEFTGLPLTIFVIVFLILLGTFLGITDSIVNGVAMVKFDNSLAHSLYLIRTPAMAKIFYVITDFADQITIGILLAVSLIYLYL